MSVTIAKNAGFCFGVSRAVEQGKMVAVFYPVIPMLNPMIYSLRNEDVKEAVVKAIVRET